MKLRPHTPHTNAIIGPPGTGKTERLLSIAEDLIQKGIPPDKIAYVTFTRAAAAEFMNRVEEKFGYTRKDMPWIKTLHAMAYNRLGLTPGCMMKAEDWNEIGEALNAGFEDPYDDSTNELTMKFRESNLGGMMRHVHFLSRATGEPLKKVLGNQPPKVQDLIPLYRLQKYVVTVDDYKREMALMDYTDLLEEGVKLPPLNVSHVIVDEAQDFSYLQWRCAEAMWGSASEIYLAGDDEQGIHEWAGADLNHFLRLISGADTVEVLKKSYRLPEKIYDMCIYQSGKIKNKYPKQWTHNGAMGNVNWIATLDYVAWEALSGTVALLARNHYLLDKFREQLESASIRYLYRGKPGRWAKYVPMITGWMQLSRGKKILGKLVKKIYSMLRPDAVAAGYRKLPGLIEDREYSYADLKASFGLKIGSQAPWTEALYKIPDTEKTLLWRCQQRGEDISSPPMFVIDTIHAVKGREFWHVYLCTDVSRAVRNELDNYPDREHRVFYTAMSRAKQSLNIVNPMTGMAYRI